MKSTASRRIQALFRSGIWLTAPVLGTNAPKYVWPVLGGQIFHYGFPEGVTHANGIQVGFTRNYAPTTANLSQDALVATVRYA